PDLKKRIRVHLLNAHGLDEAGIDGGGIFREFLSELLKSGFNPNQGFFRTTNEGLLYPSPTAEMLTGESFTRHYYFLGRILGKLEHPHTVPADGAVGVEVEGHQAFWTCDNKPFISVLTTVPPHTDSLGVSTKTKAGLVTEDDLLPF
ncbi:hypothetical protein NFI96_007804, partial [Prochilodus magdalenae]